MGPTRDVSHTHFWAYIGPQAVSKYHQLRTFFPADDVPHYDDHDFPVKGYQIVPDGYLHLRHESVIPPKVTKDHLGRNTVEVPCGGELFVYNRAIKHSPSNIATHMNDLRHIFKENEELKKKILCLICDGGSDWSYKSGLNEFYIGRFWRDTGVQCLICTCEAPYSSRYNPIEHKWSPLSKYLAGVQLSACLPGEDKPPCEQGGLTENEIKYKEEKVFHKALDELNDYWDGKIHGGFKIKSVPMKTGKNLEISYTEIYDDYEEVKEFFDTCLTTVLKNKKQRALLEEWRELSKHMERRPGMLVFKKPGCQIENDITPKLPKSEKWLLIPPLTPDSSNPGHYKTYEQLSESTQFSPVEQLFTGSGWGMKEKCPKCRYVFSSIADKKKHNSFIHGGAKKRKIPSDDSALGDDNQAQSNKRTKKNVTTCRVCKSEFPTRWMLLKHQGQTGHSSGRGRPTKL